MIAKRPAALSRNKDERDARSSAQDELESKLDHDRGSEVAEGSEGRSSEELLSNNAEIDAQEETAATTDPEDASELLERDDGSSGEGSSERGVQGESQADQRLRIHRERSSQRIHQRTSAPLHVTINDHEYTAVDWSLGGLQVRDFDQPAKRGDRILLTLSIPFQGFHVAFNAKAEVIRENIDAGDLGLQFVDLSDRARELMVHFLDELIRGSMGPTEDTIQRIDLPVTPTDIERLRHQAGRVPARRQRFRSIMIGSLYIVLGITVVGYLAFAIYANVLRLEIRSAVLAAPMQALSAPADGVLVSIGKIENDALLLGEQLFVIGDPTLQERAARAALAVSEKRSQVTRLEENLAKVDASGAGSDYDRLEDLAVARREVGLALQQLTAVETNRAGMVVKAPTDGRVRRVFKAPGSMVVKGEPLVLFERTSEPRQIHAFLTQDEILKVATGDAARIYIPSTGASFNATVAEIDRSWGAIEPDVARYDWEETRNALVILDQPDLNTLESREELNAGTPVVVIFQRSFGSALIADFLNGLNTDASLSPTMSNEGAGSNDR